jgi:hypothetical protein
MMRTTVVMSPMTRHHNRQQLLLTGMRHQL